MARKDLHQFIADRTLELLLHDLLEAHYLLEDHMQSVGGSQHVGSSQRVGGSQPVGIQPARSETSSPAQACVLDFDKTVADKHDGAMRKVASTESEHPDLVSPVLTHLCKQANESKLPQKCTLLCTLCKTEKGDTTELKTKTFQFCKGMAHKIYLTRVHARRKPHTAE